MIVLFGEGYVLTFWALWRECVALEMEQMFTKLECSGRINAHGLAPIVACIRCKEYY